MKSNDYLLDVHLKTWPFISAGIIGILYYIKAALNIIISVAGDLILLGFLLLLYRSLNTKIERKITPALKIKCENLKIRNIEEKEYKTIIHVECEEGKIWIDGCPKVCEKYSGRMPTGSGAIGGAIILGLLGAAIEGGVGALIGGLIGAGLGNALETQSNVERAINEARRKGKDVELLYYYYKLNKNSLLAKQDAN